MLAPVQESDEAAYLDFYGQCAVEPCMCLKGEWLGRRCPNWRPNGARSVDELMAKARRLHEEPRTCA